MGGLDGGVAGGFLPSTVRTTYYRKRTHGMTHLPGPEEASSCEPPRSSSCRTSCSACGVNGRDMVSNIHPFWEQGVDKVGFWHASIEIVVQ